MNTTSTLQRLGLTSACLAILLVGCATPADTSKPDPIDDLIKVSELEPLKTVRFRHQYSYKQLSEDYVVLASREDRYLVAFKRRCRELNQYEIRPDIRYEANVLRAGLDTIRGCPIGEIYQIDKALAEELELIANEL
ncbi:MAG: DUF6491 family protein [Woeseiaceae bacterium]